MAKFYVLLMVMVISLSKLVNSNAIPLIPYNTSKPCIIDCYNKCVPNNKCSYIPEGFECKMYRNSCRLVCDKSFCPIQGGCQGCNMVVDELRSKYGGQGKILPAPPQTCKNKKVLKNILFGA
uniref:Uncharacterized protein n=1 Tax=Clytia hemisphaerica TaxID=252671 RepID=A0A7M5X1B4_9CNID|eukprot:TCONS_00026883-protein